MSLSPTESTELTAQVAELAKAGLPLAPGLRALGRELRGRLARAMEDLATRLEAGQSLQAAVEAQGRAFPAHLPALLACAAAQGRLAETMTEFVAYEQACRDRRRRVWVAAAYPAALLIALLAILMCMSLAFHDFGQLFLDWGMELPDSTLLAVWTLDHGARWVTEAVGVVAVTVWLGLKMRWTRRLIYHVPFWGPMWRWAGLEQFCRLMALFLRQEMPLPAALQFAAGASTAPDLAYVCHRIARQIDEGRSLGQCLAARREFPGMLVVLADWNQERAVLADSFQAAANLCGRRVEIQISLVEAALPPCAFAAIVLAVFTLAIGLFLPFIKLIQMLT